MIGLFDSVIHAGFFSQSDQMIKMCLSLVGSIGTVMLPRVASMHSQGNQSAVETSIIKAFNIASGLSFALFFGILGISLKFASFFFGNSFSMVGYIMLIEAPVIIFISWSSVLGTMYLLPLNRMKVYTLSVGMGAIVSIVLNFVLIPALGVYGATISTVIAEITVVAYQYWEIRKEFPLFTLTSGIWKYFLSGLIMFIVVFWMNQTFKMTTLQLMLQILVGGFIYVALNILLKTQLWEMAFNLWHQKKNQKVSKMTNDELRLLIPNIQSQFVKEFRIVKKTRESQRDFIRNIDKLEESLDLISKNPAFVRANAIVLAVQLRELSAVFESGSKWMNSNQSYQLVKFSKFLRTLANKIERFQHRTSHWMM
ncbi:polysaccharide biosynthesis C-terminal domain-containing protein [Lactococcus fujiensis]|uniref:Uncharacterized protein n=2 Tax=Lactococcus fujiensis TaxID=610251 RepID=A0A2A5RPT9_9LACT|nr:oligosaccharide flippase family protein [Lactococcus fujiensis]PCS01436.1 hypothetical protein RT41_GL000200 [Lactococcus fujiensis JCM 16395]